MGTWLRRLWTDEDAFKTAARSGIRFAVGALGALVQAGVIPTGVEGGAYKFGPFITALGFLLPSRAAVQK